MSSRGRLRPGSEPNGRVRPMENADANQRLNNRGNVDLFPSSINQFISKLRERIPNIGLGLGVHIEDPDGNSRPRSSSSSRSRSSSSRSSSGTNSVMKAIGQLGGLFNRRRNSPPSKPSPTSPSHSANDVSLGSNARGHDVHSGQWQQPLEPSHLQQPQFSSPNLSPSGGVPIPNAQTNNGHFFNSGFPQTQPNTVNANPIPQPVVQPVVSQPSFGFPQPTFNNQQQMQPTFSLQQQHQQFQLQQQQHQQHQQQQQANAFSFQPQPAIVQNILPQNPPSPNVVAQPSPQQVQSVFNQPSQSLPAVQQQPFHLTGNQNMFMQQQAFPSTGNVIQPNLAPNTNFQFMGNQQSVNVRGPVLPTSAPVMTHSIQTNGQTIINGARGVFQSPQSVLQMSFNPGSDPSQALGLQNAGVSGSQTPGQFVDAHGHIFNLQPSGQSTYQIVNGQLVPVQQPFQLFPTGQTVPPRQSHQPAVQIPNAPVQMSAFESHSANNIRRSQNPNPPTRVPFSFGLFSSNSGTNAKISNLTSHAKQLVEQNAQIELQNQLLQQLLIEQVLNSHGINTTDISPTVKSPTTNNSVAIPSHAIQPAAVAFNWREGTVVNNSNAGIRRVIHGNQPQSGVKVISLRAANTVSPFDRPNMGITRAPTLSNSLPLNVAGTRSRLPIPKTTYDPEVLPQYRNSTNATLRSMDRTDRLNTTDIPEEIEVNGISLDSPADRNGVGTPHPLDSYVHGVHGHNNMGTRPVTPATAFAGGMAYGTRKNETLRKMDRTDRLNTTDIPEEIEVNGQSLDSPADRNGLNIHHPLDYLVHGVTPRGGGVHVQASYNSYNRPAPPPEEPEEMLFSASHPGYIDTTIGLGTNVMDMKHFRDPTLFDAVSHQAYDLMHHLRFSLSRIPIHVLHGIQYWMPNIPYDVFSSIKNAAPKFYQGFHDSIGSIPTSVAHGIINLVDMIRFSSAKTTKPVKTVASEIAKVLHDSFTSPKPPTTQNLFDFRIFDMIQLTTTTPMPITTPSPAHHSAKTLAKLMNLVKLLVYEPSTTTVATTTTTAVPGAAVNATQTANVSVASNANATASNKEVIANITVTKVETPVTGQTTISKVSVTVNKVKSTESKSNSTTNSKGTVQTKALPIENKPVVQLEIGQLKNQHQKQQQAQQQTQQQKQTTHVQQNKQHQQQQYPPQQQLQQPFYTGPGVRLLPTPPQNQPRKEAGFPMGFGQSITGNAMQSNSRTTQILTPGNQGFIPPPQKPQSNPHQQNTMTKHGIFEIQSSAPSSSKNTQEAFKPNEIGMNMKPKARTDYPTQVPPKLYPTQVPPNVRPLDNKKGFRHERIATPPVYQHQPVVTEAYVTRPPYQPTYPTIPRYRQPVTTLPPRVLSTAPPYYDNYQHQPQTHQGPAHNVDYFQNTGQHGAPDYNYQNTFFGEGPTQPSPTDGFGNSFGFNGAQAQNPVRQPIENTIQYKEFSNANRKGFRISEVFGRKKRYV